MLKIVIYKKTQFLGRIYTPDLSNKHEVKRKVQLQFLRQVIVQLETFLSC